MCSALSVSAASRRTSASVRRCGPARAPAAALTTHVRPAVTEFLECGSLYHLLHPRAPPGEGSVRAPRLGCAPHRAHLPRSVLHAPRRAADAARARVAPCTLRARSLARILRYAEGIAQGMQYLHSCNVIHRDLKSGNILLDGRDNIKGAQTAVLALLVRTLG